MEMETNVYLFFLDINILFLSLYNADKITKISRLSKLLTFRSLTSFNYPVQPSTRYFHYLRSVAKENRRNTKNMTNLEHYLHDGANWQAQAVLAYVRSQAFRVRECTKPLMIDPEIEAGRFENCREQGYVFRLRIGVEILKNYAVFEHRNSDSIVIFKSDSHSINTPGIDEIYGERGKYDYDHSFSYGQIVECGDVIIEDMENLVRDFVEKHPSYLMKNQ